MMLNIRHWLGCRHSTLLIALLLTSVFVGCARSPIKNADQAMRPAHKLSELKDDLEFDSLVKSLEANIAHLQAHTKASSQFRFGPRKLTRDEYIASLEYLLARAKSDPSGRLFRQALHENFEPYEVYGQDKWGEVFITSYFEPMIIGSRKATEKHTHPIYGVPNDMVTVDLESFAAVRPSLRAIEGKVFEQRSRSNFLRGRLEAPKNPGEPARVTAYPDRSQIYSGTLTGKAPVLAWVDPIDGFFLEIQGSGVIQFDDGSTMNVGYAAQNGHRYVAIGKHLTDAIPLEKMSLQTIEAHLRTLSQKEVEKILSLNPSYVFFRILPTAGVTFLGTEVSAGRTIATDYAYFPKGALGFLEFEKPVFTSPDETEPQSWQPASRFVLDQDTGGAIRGPHRVDLFWGRGKAARQAAGVIKNKGRLIYFVPKDDFLANLANSKAAPLTKN